MAYAPLGATRHKSSQSLIRARGEEDGKGRGKGREEKRRKWADFELATSL